MTRLPAPPDWQAELASAVTDPALPAPPRLMLPPSQSLRARLAIYRNNALVPLVQALEDSFPACRRLLGASLWRRLLLRFVRACPPASPVLQNYGLGLPEFLAGAPECRAYPQAPDLARLELAVVEAWHARDADLLQPADFAHLLAAPDGLPGLRFAWHPAARLLASAHPVGTLWLAAMPRQQVPAAATTPGAETVLVTRGEWVVQVRVLAPAEAAFVQALEHGQTLADALETALDAEPAADPAALLQVLVEGGFACALPGTQAATT